MPPKLRPKPPETPMVENGFATERNRKAKMTLAGIVLAVLIEVARGYGVPISPELVWGVLGATGTYNIGQGMADFGKYRK
jgi:hypothetical protein